ncbi:transglycosylase domain-containing protein [Spirilliplanes yamanashiensis]|uniref:transglycosylase domain-containing protein n=1 Tax=Spirilliplanes yamanashiensis TaxID=42233 RepID=UPI001EF1D232|nr:transglycosylase domain-containing protein [Spirilliplanes yamanashiensis]MDP9814923.1 membrane peptidoglycan carboxypeptidase [Spirilliplanes yamanashiensis]
MPSGRASYLHPATGRPAGSASVAAARASVGAGRASVGAGRASVGSAPVGSTTSGRAAVGAASVGAATPGRATVARAAVRPAGAMDELGAPGAGGPPKSEAALKRAKRRRRANILTAAAAVLVILLGTGVVGFTWFYDDVDLVAPKVEAQTTVVFDATGKKLMTFGTQNRSVVPEGKINKFVKDAVVAAEDKNFYDHGGIDMKGIARAAWNNFSGGTTQGASTITQQYARHAAEMKEISYNRKLREAVLARKLESDYKKPQILGLYLNAVYFGRGAYGVEAAAQTFFRKSVLTPVGQKGAITAGEAALLASMIKQPEPVEGGHPGYDPANGEEATQQALQRWNYTLGNMVEKGWLNPADRPTELPKVQKKTNGSSDIDSQPLGKIKKYIAAELKAMNITEKELNEGGLRVHTTIDPKVQKAAEEVADRDNKDSPMSELAKTYKTAIVAVDPNNGRVLAYYGGPDGTGWDYAGLNNNWTEGGRPPGSTFKIYTLLAALKAGVSFKTTFDSTVKNKLGKTISNSERQNLKCDKVRCPLEMSTIESYNFPFYWIADGLGPDKVLDAAHDAGIQHIRAAGGGKILNVDKGEKGNFDNEIGFGQYEVPVIEHANGIATIANDGVYNKAHFIQKVEKRDPKSGEFKPYKVEKRDRKQAFEKDIIADLQGVLKQIPGHNGKALSGGRPAIGKTGTWEASDQEKYPKANGDAWMVGATKQIAAAVWIGNEKLVKGKDGIIRTEQLPIKIPGGDRGMTGGSYPALVWKKFLDAASDAIDAPEENFLPRVFTGSADNEIGNGQPAPVVEQPTCGIFDFNCQQNGGNNGNNGNNGGNPTVPGLPGFPGNGNDGNNGGGNDGNNGGGNDGNNGGGNDGEDGEGEPTTTLPGPG